MKVALGSKFNDSFYYFQKNIHSIHARQIEMFIFRFVILFSYFNFNSNEFVNHFQECKFPNDTSKILITFHLKKRSKQKQQNEK